MSDIGAAPAVGWTAAALVLLCAIAVLLSMFVVRRVIRLAIMDVPGGRSAHDRPIPRGGGAGMVAAVLLGLPAAVALLRGRPLGWHASPVQAAILIETAVVLLAGVSWLDDVRELGYREKLAAQLAAAALTLGAVMVATPVLPPARLLLPGIAIGFCWVVFVTNAMNFIDGLNGLAAGTTALCGLFAAFAGWMAGDSLAVAVALPMSAGLLGFLPFNYPKARIFLGDVGSQVCGLLAALLGLLLLADARPAGCILVPLVLAGILWDVTFTLCRRALARERLTQAHRGHLYQVASRTGLPAAWVTAIHWMFAFWGGMLGLAVRPVPAVMLVLLPQLAWTLVVRHRATRAGLQQWS